MAVSIPRIRACERWMALSERRMPVFLRSRRPGFSGWRPGKTKNLPGTLDGRSGTLDRRPGTQDGHPDREKRRRVGKKRSREAQKGCGSPTFAPGDPYRGRSSPPGRQGFAPGACSLISEVRQGNGTSGRPPGVLYPRGRRHCEASSSAAFQAALWILRLYPRAMPWAELKRPFGPQAMLSLSKLCLDERHPTDAFLNALRITLARRGRGDFTHLTGTPPPEFHTARSTAHPAP